jgi:VanZ family protein
MKLLPAFLWLIFITGLSVMPSVQLPKFELFAPDKLGHALAYGILTWLGLRGLRNPEQGRLSGRTGALVCLFAAFYGVLMEFVQGAFLPGRFYEFDDMIANTVGAVAAWGIVRVLSL